jgi:hypothetical protein
MNENDSTAENDLREEYDLKKLKIRKMGSEHKIFNRITTLFRWPSNDSIQKAQKIENQILAKINNPEIICKVSLDKDDNVKIFFEQKIKSEPEIKDIYLYEALNIARKNTQEHQDINIFSRDPLGNCYPLFLLKQEIDLHNSMQEILSFYPRSLFNKLSNFNRERTINFLRGKQTAKQLTHLYGKEKLQQQKFVSENKIGSVASLPTVISLLLTMVSIVFLGLPGNPEFSVIVNIAKFAHNPSVDYKTCDIKTDKHTPAKKGKDQFCTSIHTFNQFSYLLIFLYLVFMQLLVTYFNLHNRRDLLIISHALDILPDKLSENNESQ